MSSKIAAAALVIALTLVQAVALLAAGSPPGDFPNSYVGPLPKYTAKVVFTIWASAWGGVGGVSTVELWYQKAGASWQRYGDPLPSGPWTWQFNTTNTGGDGFYGFYSIATDTVGNQQAPPPVADTNTTVDTHPPVSVLDPLPGYTTELHFNITARASDATSGVASVRLYFSNTGKPGSYRRYWPSFALVGDRYIWTFAANLVDKSTGGQGPYHFITRAVDAAGNIEPEPAVAKVSTVVDTLPPTGSLDTTLNAYTITAVVAIKGRVADANGLAWVQLWYMRGSNDWASYGPSIPDPTGAVAWQFDSRSTGGDGSYRFMLVAADPAGNRLILEGPSTMVDTTPPVLTINTPQQGGVERSSTVSIAWGATDATSGLDHYEVSLDGAAFVNVGLNVKEVLRDLPDGHHTAIVRAYDKAGNVAEVKLTYTVNTSTIPGASLGLPLLAALGAGGAALAFFAWRRRRKPMRKDSPPT